MSVKEWPPYTTMYPSHESCERARECERGGRSEKRGRERKIKDEINTEEAQDSLGRGKIKSEANHHQ